MGVNTDRTIMFMGDRMNRKQGKLAIPALAAANSPGVLDLQTVSGTTVADVYLWPNSTGSELRFGTTFPTTIDSDGTALAAGSGATAALDNLASVAINTALVPATAAIDLGTDALPFRTEHLLTSLVLNQTTGNYTFTWANPGAARAISIVDPGGTDVFAWVAATQDLTGKTYNGLTVAASANTFTLTRGTASISLAEGNTDIALGAAAQLDIAAAKTVNIDMDFTVNTEAVTLNQSLSTTDAVAFATGSTIGNLTLANGSITDSGGAISFGNENLTTTGTVNVAADNVDMTLGASGATDSRIFFDGSGNLKFYDSNMGAARSLTELYTGTTLNPAVSGDLSITDGKFTWTNAVDEANNAVWTFAGTDKTDISIVSSITTGTSLLITADACANGSMMTLDADGGVGATGYYLKCYNGSANKFLVGENGATTIGGNAALTAALTITAGDLVVTNGQVTAATTADSVNKISRNNATGTAPTLEIEETHVNGGVALLVDSNVTDAIDAVQIEHDGPAFGLKITGTSATGTQAKFIGPASQTTSIAVIDGTTGSWIGADNVGMLHLSSDGVLIAGANLLRIDATGANNATSVVELTSSGNVAAASDGLILKIAETGAAQATSYAVNIASTNNEALHVDAGLSLFDERVSITLADNTGPALSITNPDTTGNTNAVTIAPSGSGYGLAITPQETDTRGILITAKAAGTVSQLVVDLGTNNWNGAANVGAIHSSADAAFADVAAAQIYLGASGAIDDSRGHCLRIVDSSAVTGTMGYPVYVASNDAQMGGIYISTEATATALNVAAGVSTFAGKVTCAAGVRTQVAVDDIHDTVPTNANVSATFGAANAAGAGFLGVINDAGGDANVWLVMSDGTSWFYLAKGTKAV